MPSTFTIIICTKNRRDDLLRTLDSIKEQTIKPDQLIIVDCSDTPLSQDAAFVSHIAWFEQHAIVYRYVHTKPGLTRQRNLGIDHATGDIVYFFDDDVVLLPDYCKQMQSIFHDPSWLGGMGDVINIPPRSGWKYRLFRRIFLLPVSHRGGIFSASGMPMHAYGLPNFQRVKTLGGCGMAYRRSALANHRFDEKLTGYAYMEDCDMAYRVSCDGPLFFNPAARLYHYQSPVSRDRYEDNRAMFMRNYRYLFFKLFFPQAHWRIVLNWWSVVGLFVEALILRNWAALRGYARGLKRTKS